ncbi:concanavalin A-like lectin/glucanase domain-containing protein [Syncephalis pseudoplumigaleata]|uniref:Concanavalin A-like lectin/glucanase domain-containing protein n=1 Tax=Syncephalis pseudoplumigaleata TaxID=1712513 RepID=A0A4P9YWV9_9FUNG|nr:concanavalin A-like lectin/glucanase domain-containing protein [Syncephalis pseudoplumigaleata]|eukprot:RKP24613.1 concanavalin A-like lectin/glucanase domain-containing protein [Syncephalis pseudoplumigaleata]
MLRTYLIQVGISTAALLPLLAAAVWQANAATVPAGAEQVKPDVEVKRVSEPSLYSPRKSHYKQASNVIFEDNFDSNELNDKYWSYDIGDGCSQGNCGWGNNEKEIYDDKSVKTGLGKEGYLQITAKRIVDNSQANRNASNDRWSSSKIITKSKFTFTYGRVDVRAKLPVVDGAFSAIWMMPQDNAYGAWPHSGEIDIAEFQSIWRKKHQPEQNRTPGSLHLTKYNGGTAQSFWAEGNDPSEWHVYSMIWREDGAKFLLDGKEYGSYTPPTTQDPTEWPFNKPFYLIMNLAIEPGFGTKVPADVNKITMEVDWIRVTKE